MKQNVQQVRPRLPALIMTGMAGGAAETHTSPAGSANGNAQWQSGAARGADRAAERMNAPGTGMTPSGEAELDATGSARAKGKSKR